MVILGYSVVELLKKTWSEVWKDNVLGMSAEAAYNLFFPRRGFFGHRARAMTQREPVSYGGRISTTDQIDEPSPKVQ